MREVKLLALDLDDTLLREDLTISFHTKNVLKKIEDSGVIVILASGRSPTAMERYARDLGMHKRPGYLVCNNGTSIQESHTGKKIKEYFLPVEAALAVFDLVDAEGFPVQIYDEGTIYISRRNEYADIDQKLTGQRQVVVDNFRGFLAMGAQKMVIPGDPTFLQPLEILLKTFVGDRATIFTSKPYFLEILPPGTGKGEALAVVAQILGIDRNEVMAIGDSMNDESMIRWAGLGVAMANGDPRIKTIAKAVTNRTNEEDGVADFVEQYLLKDRPYER